MSQALLNVPSWLLACSIIGGSVALSLLVMWALRDRTHRAMVEGHNDVAGFIFAGVGVVYSVFLAFTIDTDWQQFLGAQTAVDTESAALRSLYEQSGTLPLPIRSQSQRELRTYTELVLGPEWKAMQEGNDSPLVDASLTHLYAIYGKLQNMPAETVAAGQSLQLLNSLAQERALRIDAADGSLSTVFWLILVFGAVLTVGFALLFYLDNLGVQATMIAILTALVASLLYLLVVIDHPFTGSVHVSPEPFIAALEHMQAHPTH